MKRFASILILLALCSSSSAEGVVVVGAPSADVRRFGLKQGTATGYLDNRANLQAALDAGAPIYPYFFPGSATNSLPFYFDDTIIIPADAGRAWLGTGRTELGGIGGGAAWGSPITMLPSTAATTFDGTTNKLSATALSVTDATNATPIVVTVTGHGLATGSIVTISGVTGNTNANGTFSITRISDDTFSLQSPVSGSNVAGNGAFGGTAICMTGRAVVTGRTVNARDVYNSVYISGGTSVTAGWYGIAGIDAVANEWILDRNWSTATTTNGAGTYCPPIVQNRGVGTYHRGLQFSHRFVIAGGGTGTTCYHVLSNFSPNTTASTGKHHFESCSFGYSAVGIFCGRNLALHNSGTTSIRWLGWNDNHADTISTSNCTFTSVNNCIVARNQQSVMHRHQGLVAKNLDGSVFRFEAGGKLTADCIEIAGSGGSSVQTALTLGSQVASNDGPYLIRGVSFDGGNNTINPQLVVTEWIGINRPASVTIEGGIVNHTAGGGNEYLVDIQSDCRLRLRDIQGSGSAPFGIWANSIRLRHGATSDYKPHVVIEGCVLDVTTDPSEVLDLAACDAGIVVEFIGNCKVGGAPLRNGRYVINAEPPWDTTTSGWAEASP